MTERQRRWIAIIDNEADRIITRFKDQLSGQVRGAPLDVYSDLVPIVLEAERVGMLLQGSVEAMLQLAGFVGPANFVVVNLNRLQTILLTNNQVCYIMGLAAGRALAEAEILESLYGSGEAPKPKRRRARKKEEDDQ